MNFPAGLVTQLAAQPFNGELRRRDDTLLTAGLHHQGRQMRQAVVFHRLRQQSRGYFRRRPFAEVTQSELFLALNGMALPVPLRRQVFIDRNREHVDLIRDKFEQRGGWPLAYTQCPARIAQIATHQSVAQAVVVAAPAPDGRQVARRQRVVTDQLAPLDRRIK
jgi:hypothetical protein